MTDEDWESFDKVLHGVTAGTGNTTKQDEVDALKNENSRKDEKQQIGRSQKKQSNSTNTKSVRNETPRLRAAQKRSSTALRSRSPKRSRPASSTRSAGRTSGRSRSSTTSERKGRESRRSRTRDRSERRNKSQEGSRSKLKDRKGHESQSRRKQNCDNLRPSDAKKYLTNAPNFKEAAEKYLSSDVSPTSQKENVEALPKYHTKRNNLIMVPLTENSPETIEVTIECDNKTDPENQDRKNQSKDSDSDLSFSIDETMMTASQCNNKEVTKTKLQLTFDASVANDKGYRQSCIKSMCKDITPHRVTHSEHVLLEYWHEAEAFWVFKKYENAFKAKLRLVNGSAMESEEGEITDDTHKKDTTNVPFILAVSIETLSKATLQSGLSESLHRIHIYSGSGSFSATFPNALDDEGKTVEDKCDESKSELGSEESFFVDLNGLLEENVKEYDDSNNYDLCLLVFDDWHQATTFFRWAANHSLEDSFKKICRVAVCPRRYIVPSNEFENTLESQSMTLHYNTERFLIQNQESSSDQRCLMLNLEELDIPSCLNIKNIPHNICTVSLKFIKKNNKDVITQIGCMFLTPDAQKDHCFLISNPFGENITGYQLKILNLVKDSSGITFMDSNIKAEKEEDILSEFLNFLSKFCQDSLYPTVIASFSSNVTYTVLLKALNRHHKLQSFYQCILYFMDMFKVLQFLNEYHLRDMPDLNTVCKSLNISNKDDNALETSKTVMHCLEILLRDKIFSPTTRSKFTKHISHMVLSCKKMETLKLKEDLNLDQNKEKTISFSIQGFELTATEDLRISCPLYLHSQVDIDKFTSKELKLRFRNTTKEKMFVQKGKEKFMIYHAIAPLEIPALLPYLYKDARSSSDEFFILNQSKIKVCIPTPGELSEDLSCDDVAMEDIEDEENRQIYLSSNYVNKETKDLKIEVKNQSPIYLRPKENKGISFVIKELQLTRIIDVNIDLNNDMNTYTAKVDNTADTLRNGRIYFDVLNRTMKDLKFDTGHVFGYLFCSSSQIAYDNIQINISNTVSDKEQPTLEEQKEIELEQDDKELNQDYDMAKNRSPILEECKDVEYEHEDKESNQDHGLVKNRSPISDEHTNNEIEHEDEKLYQEYDMVKNSPGFLEKFQEVNISPGYMKLASAYYMYYEKRNIADLNETLVCENMIACESLKYIYEPFSTIDALLDDLKKLELLNVKSLLDHLNNQTFETFGDSIQNAEEFLAVIIFLLNQNPSEKSLSMNTQQLQTNATLSTVRQENMQEKPYLGMREPSLLDSKNSSNYNNNDVEVQKSTEMHEETSEIDKPETLTSQDKNRTSELYCYICQVKTHETKDCLRCTACNSWGHRVTDCKDTISKEDVIIKERGLPDTSKKYCHICQVKTHTTINCKRCTACNLWGHKVSDCKSAERIAIELKEYVLEKPESYCHICQVKTHSTEKCRRCTACKAWGHKVIDCKTFKERKICSDDSPRSSSEYTNVPLCSEDVPDVQGHELNQKTIEHGQNFQKHTKEDDKNDDQKENVPLDAVPSKMDVTNEHKDQSGKASKQVVTRKGSIMEIKGSIGIIKSDQESNIIFHIDNASGFDLNEAMVSGRNMDVFCNAKNANLLICKSADAFFGKEMKITHFSTSVCSEISMVKDDKDHHLEYKHLYLINNYMSDKLKEARKETERKPSKKVKTTTSEGCRHFKDPGPLCKDWHTEVCSQKHDLCHELPDYASNCVECCENFLKGFCKKPKCKDVHLSFSQFEKKLKQSLSVKRKSCFVCHGFKSKTGCKLLSDKKWQPTKLCFHSFGSKAKRKGCRRAKCTFLHEIPDHLDFEPFDGDIDEINSIFTVKFADMKNDCIKCEENLSHGEQSSEAEQYFISREEPLGSDSDEQTTRVVETYQDSCEDETNDLSLDEYMIIDETRDDDHEEMPAAKRSVCKYFQSKSGCINGSRCIYKHEDLRSYMARRKSSDSRRPAEKETLMFLLRAIESTNVKSSRMTVKGRIIVDQKMKDIIKGQKVTVQNEGGYLPGGLSLAEGDYRVLQEDGVMYLLLQVYNSTRYDIHLKSGCRLGRASFTNIRRLSLD